MENFVLYVLLLFIFPNLLFSLLLYDVVRRFSAKFYLRIQIEPKRCRNRLKINQLFGNVIVNECTVRRWFVKFRSGYFSLEDEPRSARPTVIQDKDLRILVETDPSQAVRVMTELLGVSSHTVLLV